jgi:hypothetical protein
MIRLRLTDPKALTLAAGTGMTAWGATGFSTDLKKVLMFVVPSFMGGAAVPHNPTSQPNIAPESHIITPYQNNLTE